MSLKCCLSVTYYIEIVSYQDKLYFLYLSLCLRLGLYMSYLCNLFVIIIFIYVTINHITSLIQTNLFFEHVCQKFSLRVLLSFCLIFIQFQSGVAYKSVAYKKSVYLLSCSGRPYLLGKSQQQKQQKKITDMLQVNSNRTTSTDFVIVSFLLTFNRFHNLF